MCDAIEEYLKTLNKTVMCADYFEQGVKRQRPYVAVAYRYIQVNTKWRWSFLAFDVDRANGGIAHELSDLPAPTYLMRNPKNGHAHLLYQLATPVLVGEQYKSTPQQFYSDVDAMMTIQLGADPAFSKVFTKTPYHPDWETTYTATRFELVELKEYLTVDVKQARKYFHEIRNAIVPDSRTMSLFNLVRKWGYGNVAAFKEKNDSQGFCSALFHQAGVLSGVVFNEIPGKPRLSAQEYLGVVRSVYRWIWFHYNGKKGSADPAFSALQRQRSLKRWGDNSETLRVATELRQQGKSYQHIADQIGVSKRTIIRWLK